MTVQELANKFPQSSVYDCGHGYYPLLIGTYAERLSAAKSVGWNKVYGLIGDHMHLYPVMEDALAAFPDWKPKRIQAEPEVTVFLNGVRYVIRSSTPYETVEATAQPGDHISVPGKTGWVSNVARVVAKGKVIYVDPKTDIGEQVAKYLGETEVVYTDVYGGRHTYVASKAYKTKFGTEVTAFSLDEAFTKVFAQHSDLKGVPFTIDGVTRWHGGVRRVRVGSNWKYIDPTLTGEALAVEAGKVLGLKPGGVFEYVGDDQLTRTGVVPGPRKRYLVMVDGNEVSLWSSATDVTGLQKDVSAWAKITRETPPKTVSIRAFSLQDGNFFECLSFTDMDVI